MRALPRAVGRYPRAPAATRLTQDQAGQLQQGSAPPRNPPGPWPRCYPDARHPSTGTGGEQSRPTPTSPGPAPPLTAARAKCSTCRRRRAGARRNDRRRGGHVLAVLPVPGVRSFQDAGSLSACRRWISVRRGGKTASRADANHAEARQAEVRRLPGSGRARGEGQQMKILKRPRRPPPAAARPVLGPAGSRSPRMNDSARHTPVTQLSRRGHPWHR